MVYHAPHVSLKTRQVRDEKGGFSFVVSRKVAKKAVTRNTVKRRARAIVHDALRGDPPPYRALFYFKKGADSLSFDELKQEIFGLLAKTQQIR